MSTVSTSLTCVYKTGALLHVDCKSDDKKQSTKIINGVIAFDYVFMVFEIFNHVHIHG